VCMSFLVAALILFGRDTYLVLNYENGMAKILAITAFAMVCSHYFDLYSPNWLKSRGDTYFRILLLLGILSFVLAGMVYVDPGFTLGRGHFSLSIVILTFALIAWRIAYLRIVRIPALRERVIVLGAGERAERLVNALRSRADLGMDVVRWAGAMGDGSATTEAFTSAFENAHQRRSVDRVVVAMQDRRNRMPQRELLQLRLQGVKIEEATSLLERTSGRLEVDDLYPSSLIYSDGFGTHPVQMAVRRVTSIIFSLLLLLVAAPLLPLIALAIKLTSPGPVLFSQERVGRYGRHFRVFKFRTMRSDAEAATGAVWAGKNDPRITPVGRFLRKTRLDELPQLWNVLRGDMSFIGPRPERPEFTDWLATEIPFYNLRHIVRPGLTGWAQVCYAYGSSLDDAKQKLKYDLYYIKHMSLSLDLVVAFETIKTVLLRRGAQ
jgi:sugar transferase (PEP-CTERM system associated)